MGLSRRSVRFQSAIWPGFVDAMTGLLMVLMFVLMIFMFVQSVLRETITGQESELSSLNREIEDLTVTLGLEQGKNRSLTGELERAEASLLAQVEALEKARSDLDKQVSLLDLAKAQVVQLQRDAEQLVLEKAEFEALAAQLQSDVLQAQKDLSALENERLAERAAAQILQQRLADSQAELSTLDLALEAKRKEAEETLTLLAAARAVEEAFEQDLQRSQDEIAQGVGERQKVEVLLAQARQLLSDEQRLSAEEARQAEALRQQVIALREQVGELKGLLEFADAQDDAANIQIEQLGAELNLALARAVSEERQRRALEEAERLRLEQEALALETQARNLERFKSDFFGQLRAILENQDGVSIQGDRFVFSSEVLFETGQADLSAQGQREISGIARLLRQISNDIPPQIDWIIRVDGHTDDRPIAKNGQSGFKSNWELSQARALSVVEYMVKRLGIPPQRLSANGFGEHRPLVEGTSDAARAANRRIELKLTER